MLRAIYGIDYTHARTRAMVNVRPAKLASSLGSYLGLPAKCVSLTSLLFSKAFLVTKRPLLIVGCLPRLLPHPSNSS